MSAMGSRNKPRRAAASSTKKKKGGDDESFEHSSDDGDSYTNVSSQDATDSVDDGDDGDDVEEEIPPSDSGDMDRDEPFGPESAPDQTKSGSGGSHTSGSQGPGGSNEALKVQPIEVDDVETRLLARSSRVCVRSLRQGSITIQHRNVQLHSAISSLHRPQIQPSNYPEEVEHHSSEAAIDAVKTVDRAAREK